MMSLQPRFSTRSVGMSLARPLQAGMDKVFLDLRRVSDDRGFQPSLTRRRDVIRG
jgi:hypothetical protein